tara:strand:- start:54 stop:251 length:198 start_codon:yes stop_codon:yes gene_type:complete
MKDKKRNWKLQMRIFFNFNGTETEAIEKLKEDAEYLEDEVFIRDGTEYMIQEKTIDAHGVWKKID